MTGRVKLKGKHKRGERGSVEEEQQSLKRANMADEEEVCSTNDKELPNTDSEETVQQRTNIVETSLSELKEMLVDIQITVSDILRQNSKLTKRGHRTTERVPSAEDRINCSQDYTIQNDETTG